MTDELPSDEGASRLAGCGAMLSYKILKSWYSETPFLVFREGQFLSEMFAKWIVNFMLSYVCVTSSTSTRSYLYFFRFFKFSGY